MKVELWNGGSHLDLVNEWCRIRGFPPADENLLPSTGLVVNDTHAGFVYLTNSPVCVLDQFISDPRCPSEQKRAAMTHLVDGLSMIARNSGATLISMATSAESILSAGDDCGFLRESKPFGFSFRRL